MAGPVLPFYGIQGYGPQATATAATVINALVPPRKNAITRLLALSYVNGANAHILTVLREKARTSAAVVAAAGQKVVTLKADPGISMKGPGGTASRLADRGIAAGDYLVFEMPDGGFYFDKVASVSGLAVTMTANLPTGGVAQGAVVWFLGLVGDTNPLDLLAGKHPAFAAAASVTTALGSEGALGGGVTASPALYSPLLIQSNNVTAAGTLDHYVVGYTDR